MSIVAIIPARGNSKRLPRKNLMCINGEPLVVRAIRCAKEAGIFDEIWVNSEDDEILKLVDGLGEKDVFAHRRNPILSDDDVHTAAIAFEVLSVNYYDFDSFCLLLPTSPLRTPEQLRRAYDYFASHGLDCLYSEIFGLGKHDGDFLFWRTLPFLRYISRSIIPTNSDALVDCADGSGVDIDTLEDFKRAESLLSGKTV